MKSYNYPVTIKILYEKEAKEAPYIAYIPEFDVSSCGKTEEEAVKNVKQTLEITIEEVKRKGDLEEFLKESGISVKKSLFSFPKIIIQPFSFYL